MVESVEKGKRNLVFEDVPVPVKNELGDDDVTAINEILLEMCSQQVCSTLGAIEHLEKMWAVTTDEATRAFIRRLVESLEGFKSQQSFYCIILTGAFSKLELNQTTQNPRKF